MDKELLNDAPFKALFQRQELFICDLDTDELKDLDKQNCWRAVNIQDAGIR